MTDSILNTIKQMLGLSLEDTAFDVDVLIHINNAIAVLNQLGVGPTDPVLVAEANTEWSALTTDGVLFSMVKPFVFLTTRLSFDPPGTSFILESMSKTIDQLTWRIENQANPYVPEAEEETTPPDEL